MELSLEFGHDEPLRKRHPLCSGFLYFSLPLEGDGSPSFLCRRLSLIADKNEFSFSSSLLSFFRTGRASDSFPLRGRTLLPFLHKGSGSWACSI